MTQYEPGTLGDVPLLNWYSQLVVDQDLDKLLGPSLFPMAAFMRHFTGPGVRLFFLADERGWWAVAWDFPFMGGGTWGLWVRADARRPGRARLAITFIMDALATAFERYPVLVNTTIQPAVIAKTERLGYTYLGEIPHLFEGRPCHVLFQTRETFEQRLEQWRQHECRQD